MAAPNQDEALRQMSQRLLGDSDARERHKEHLVENVIGWWGGRDDDRRWKLSLNGTIVLIKLSDNIFDTMENICYYMLAELLGLGPARYCVQYREGFVPYISLKYVLSYLPRQKMFIYPQGSTYDYSRQYPRWQIRFRVFFRQPSLTQAEFDAHFGQ